MKARLLQWPGVLRLGATLPGSSFRTTVEPSRAPAATLIRFVFVLLIALVLWPTTNTAAPGYTIRPAGGPAGGYVRPPVNTLLSDNSFEFARPAILSAVTNCAFGTVTLELSSSLQSMGSDHFRSISKSAIYGRAEYMSVNFSGQYVTGGFPGSSSYLVLPAPAYGLAAGYYLLPPGFTAHAIGDAGHIAGIIASNNTVAVWTNGVLRNLGKLGFDQAINVDVNSQVSGY